MTPEEMLAVLLGHPIRMDTNRGGIVHPTVIGENRPVAQQPQARYHNIPVVVQPNGQLQRDPRQHASGRAQAPLHQRAGQALMPQNSLVARLLQQSRMRGPDPSTAPRSVQVPR